MKTTEDLEALYGSNPRKACELALEQTKDIRVNEERMDAINTLLNMHGVEAIRGAWQNGYWCDIVATYCNTGDTYAMTVLHVRGWCTSAPSSFLVSSLGDFVEVNGSRLGIQ